MRRDLPLTPLAWTTYGLIHYFAAVPAFPADETTTFAWINVIRAATGCAVGLAAARVLERAFAIAPARLWAIAAGVAAAGTVAWMVLDRVALTTVSAVVGFEIPWAHLPHGVDLDYVFAMLAWTAAITGLRLSDRERVATQRLLEQQLAAREAKFEALAARIHPHFLFNALNTVRALIGEDPVRAREILTRLAGFLRAALTVDATRPVPFASELDLTRSYLEIERARFEDDLRVEIRVSEAAARVLVPPLVLQPLVENAVQHGTSASDGLRHVHVTGRLEHDRVSIEVANPGELDPAGNADRPSLGLALTRQRLAAMYGERAQMTLGATGGWVRATIGIERPDEAVAGRLR